LKKAVSTFIYLLFFLSGAAGLVYQVVWARMLNDIFGVTVYAVTTVLATFLAGLALGSLILGRLGDRRRHPLRFYGWLEIGIGLTALLGMGTIRLLDPVHIWAANRFESHSLALIGVRVLLGLLVVLPPTFLMGGTLPAIVRFFVDRIQRFGRQLSFLYALNTAGAVVGTLATGFLLIRWLGLQRTLWIAVAVNIVIGLLSLLLASRLSVIRCDDGGDDGPHQDAPLVEDAGYGLLVVMALSGFVTLGLEIFWTRILMLSVGTTTYSFATMLSSFLTGIALGSFIARRIVDGLRDVRRTFGWIQVGIAGTTLATLPLINSGVVQRWLTGWGSEWATLILLRFGISLLVMLVPTTLIGMTFPLAAKLRARDVTTLGGRLGEVYGANTLGNILGAAVTGFLLLPLFGLQKGIAVLVLLSIINAAWGFFPAGSARRGGAAFRRAVPLAGGLLVCLLLLVWWQPRPFVIVGEEPGDRVLYYKEGVVGTVKVLQKAQDPRRVWMAIDAIKIGESFGGVDHKQQALAHFPFLLMSEDPPRKVLSVGLGTGILIGEVARHPSVQQADCLEISPSVIEAARLFDEQNDDVLDNPRVNVINDDGVNFLRRSATRYDAIISDAKSRTTHAANAIFFSSDYYRLCREQLDDRGLMIQWVPLSVPPDELQIILRTFLDIFPYGYVLVAPPHSCFLVGLKGPLTIDVAGVERLLRGPLTANLRRYGIRDAEGLIGTLTADRESMSAWLTPGGAINSIDHPALEFYSPQSHARHPMRLAEENLLALLEGRTASLATVSLTGVGLSSIVRDQHSLGALSEALRLLESGTAAATRRAIGLLDEAMKASPALGVVQYGAAAAYRQAVRLDPSSTAALCGLGRCLLALGRVVAAGEQFQKVLWQEPDNPAALIGMAQVLVRHRDPGVRDPQEAIRLAQRAATLTDNQDARVLGSLADCYAAAGGFDQAVVIARTALPLAEAAGDEQLIREIRRRLEALRRTISR
jgi:spermidine synthase